MNHAHSMQSDSSLTPLLLAFFIRNNHYKSIMYNVDKIVHCERQCVTLCFALEQEIKCFKTIGMKLYNKINSLYCPVFNIMESNITK